MHMSVITYIYTLKCLAKGFWAYILTNCLLISDHELSLSGNRRRHRVAIRL
jgi:hypothetical protein